MDLKLCLISSVSYIHMRVVNYYFVIILLDSFSVEFLHEKPVTKLITRAPGLIKQLNKIKIITNIKKVFFNNLT